MGRPKSTKSKFDDLPEEFRTEIDKLSRESLEHKIASIAMYQCELMAAKALDQDLAQKREASRHAGEVYREGTKQNKLKIEYCKANLDAAGGPVKAHVDELPEDVPQS
jgi:hypothetical protein